MSNIQKKVKLVESIENIYSESSSVIFTHYHGLTVNQLSNLRKSLRQNNAKFRIVKNTLSKIAAKNSNITIDENLAQGPVAVAYTESDPAALAKVVVDFSKANQALTVIGGLVDKKLFTKQNVEVLAQLPSLDVLKGRIIGLLQAPATKLARVIQAPAGQVARVISAYSEKQ